MSTPSVLLPQAPPIPGLTFRSLRLPDDLDALAALMSAASEADGSEDREDAAHLANWFANPSGFDPAVDPILGFVGDEMVAYATTRRPPPEADGQSHFCFGAIAPVWRRRGLGRALLHRNLARVNEIAAANPLAPGLERRVDAWCVDTATGTIVLLESEGFKPVRWFYEMLQPDLSDIPDLAMPEGLEIRPVVPEDYRQIWASEIEAFRDHWGAEDDSEEAYQRYYGGPDFEPALWRVAWDGNEVAGVVSNMVMRAFNEQTGAQRGLVAGVSVRRPWRGRGLARALVAESLRALRDRGMTTAVLGVDADNPTGALGVYEAAGFAVHLRASVYRKVIEPA